MQEEIPGLTRYSFCASRAVGFLPALSERSRAAAATVPMAEPRRRRGRRSRMSATRARCLFSKELRSSRRTGATHRSRCVLAFIVLLVISSASDSASAPTSLQQHSGLRRRPNGFVDGAVASEPPRVRDRRSLNNSDFDRLIRRRGREAARACDSVSEAVSFAWRYSLRACPCTRKPSRRALRLQSSGDLPNAISRSCAVSAQPMMRHPPTCGVQQQRRQRLDR